MEKYGTIKVEISAEAGCCTRPETKTEPYSYPFPTPSACAGMLECVYWHPGIVYKIKKIYILSEPKYFSRQVNAINKKAACGNALSENGDPRIYTAASHTQMSETALLRPRFVVEAEVYADSEKAEAGMDSGKFFGIFFRRIEKGQYYGHEPFFGKADYPAEIRVWPKEKEVPSVNRDEDFGYVLKGIDRSGKKARPVFFHAVMENGVIDVENAKTDGEKDPASSSSAVKALYDYYEKKKNTGELPKPGFSDWVKVSHFVEIGDNGEVLDIFPADNEKKYIFMRVPMAPAGRTSGIKPGFLSDNAKYTFGFPGLKSDGSLEDSDKKVNEAKKALEAEGVMAQAVLSGVDSPAAGAVLKFFENWNQEKLKSNPAVSENLDSLSKSNTIMFSYDAVPIVQYEECVGAWEKYYEAELNKGEKGQCLITGKTVPLASEFMRVRGVLKDGKEKGVGGAAFSSANDEYAWSWGLEKTENYPIGKYAAFAFLTALNKLLADNNHKEMFGNINVVMWGDGEDDGKTAVKLLGGKKIKNAQGERLNPSLILHRLAEGKRVDVKINGEGKICDPKDNVFMVGLESNSGRLNLKFFYHNSLGDFAKNIEKFYEDAKAPVGVHLGAGKNGSALWDETWDEPTPRTLLMETVKKNKDGKPVTEPKKHVEEQLYDCILNGGKIPEEMLSAVMGRIYAGDTMNRWKAALIRAYFIRNAKNREQKGEIDMAASEKEKITINLKENEKQAFAAGRMFSLLVQIQARAIQNAKCNIYRTHFCAVMDAPLMYMTELERLSTAHLAKLSNKSEKDRNLTENLKRAYTKLSLEAGFLPKRFNNLEKYAFLLGYHYEDALMYERIEKAKKEKDEEGGEPKAEEQKTGKQSKEEKDAA